MDSFGKIVMLNGIDEQLIRGEKIKSARIYRELSQAELAECLDVTKQAISRYENNKSQMSSEVIARLPGALGFPIRYFTKNEDKQPKEQSIVYFRTKNIPKKTKEHLATKIRLLDEEIMTYYRKYIGFPEINFPDLTEYITRGKCNYSREDICAITKEIREHWGLGDEPIVNLAYVLQSNGIILSKQYINQDKTDGLSQWIQNTPYIFTSSDKESAVRSRFDNAHELGHLVMHRYVDEEEQGSKVIEKDADYFASQFLYPNDMFIKDIRGCSLSLETFIGLKEKWRISIQAIIRKCIDLELISEDKYIYFQKKISYKGWRKKEPLDNILTVEEPRLLKDATELLIENNVITKQDILNGVALYKNDIVELCNLPSDYFTEKVSDIIKFTDGKLGRKQ